MFGFSQPLILGLATAIGVFGGMPTPPKIFTTLTSLSLVQWFLVFVLVYQGGGGGGKVFLLNKNVYRYQEAVDACNKLGAQLATKN